MHFFQCIEINTKFAQALLDLKKIKGPFYSMKGKNISRMKIDFLFNYTFLNTFDFFFLPLNSIRNLNLLLCF